MKHVRLRQSIPIIYDFSSCGSGGVRVRAPPKKRAKMELAELEKMMREETEEEDEEEDSGLAGTPSAGEALVQAGTPTKESERQKHVELQSQQTTSGRRAKVSGRIKDCQY